MIRIILKVFGWRWAACRVAIILAVAAVVPGNVLSSQIAQQQQVDPFDMSSQMSAPPAPDEAPVEHGRTTPPPLPTVTQAVPAPRPVTTSAVRPAPGMAPPRLSPCYTTEEYNRAAWGTGCNCGCDEFARLASKPPAEARRCTVACAVAYYQCWAPRPTETDIAASIADMGPVGPLMMNESGGRDAIIYGIMTKRALEWEEAQRCLAP